MGQLQLKYVLDVPAKEYFFHAESNSPAKGSGGVSFVPFFVGASPRFNEDIGPMKNEKNLFEEFKASTYEEWYAEAVKLLKGVPFDKKMYTNTPEGIRLKPIYNKEDADFDVSLPGYDGYVRGTNPEGNKTRPWKISQEIYAEDPGEFNRLLLDALNKGQNSVEIILDGAVPAQAATPDGNPPYGGLHISSARDFDSAFKGVETDCVDIIIHAGPAAANIAAALYASQKGRNLKGGILFDPIGELAKTGELPRAMECAYDEMFALASYNAENMVEFTSIGVDTMPYSNAGASAVEELSAAFATATAYIRAMVGRGLDIEKTASQIRFRLGLGSNFFMEIAKLRAARMLWAKIVSEFGGSAEAQKIKAGARTAVYNKTVFDPYVNMLRTSTEAFSGVIGGIESMTVGAFDEIVRRPGEFSARIARNQQIILQEECNLAEVADPAGGSYYVESLTRSLAEKVWESFAKIEAEGGMLKALESGSVQDAVASTAAARKKLYDTRRSSVVGTNNYANMQEKPLEVCKRREDAEAKAERKGKTAEATVEIGQARGKEILERLVEAAGNGADIFELEVAICKCRSSLKVKKLNAHRAVEHFEALRNASEKYKAEHGSAPKIFLATMGPLVQHKARADFIRGFFEVGAFDVVYPNGFTTPEDAAKAFLESGAKYAVVCSTDATYPELIPAVTKALKKARADAVVYMAGTPAPEAEESYKKAGYDGAISIKSNNYETLKAVLSALGVLQ